MNKLQEEICKKCTVAEITQEGSDQDKKLISLHGHT